MLRSHANRVVSVRRVAQLNTGTRTPGVDKVLLKTPEARGRMVDHLAHYQPWAAKPARRVYIAKSNGKLRPLGIPAMLDRCRRGDGGRMPSNRAGRPALRDAVMGSGKARGCHDALEKIYRLARPNSRRKWVLDADIKGAFDHISHEHPAFYHWKSSWYRTYQTMAEPQGTWRKESFTKPRQERLREE
jgi:RNA-directed DNA polymerase